jgi:hypothetical protein
MFALFGSAAMEKWVPPCPPGLKLGWSPLISVHVPPPAYAPLPELPVRLNVLLLMTVMKKSPLAAVLPVTPAMRTWSPLLNPWPLEVMTMGAALLALVIGADSSSVCGRSIAVQAPPRLPERKKPRIWPLLMMPT